MATPPVKLSGPAIGHSSTPSPFPINDRYVVPVQLQRCRQGHASGNGFRLNPTDCTGVVQNGVPVKPIQ